MHRNRLRCVAAGALLWVSGTLGGAQIPAALLLEGLPAGVAESLYESGEVFRYDKSGSGILLKPEHPSLAVLGREHDALVPDVMVEGLYLIPYPEGSGDIDLNLYNITRRVSKIEEVEYFSARRGAFVSLFDRVYRIESIKRKRQLDDALVSEIPLFESIIMYMKEINMGPGYYETRYVYDGEALGFYVKNVTPLRSLIKIADKENLHITIVIFPTDRGYLAYGYCGVNLSNRKLVFSLLEPFSAFYKRLYAMVTWVASSLHGTSRRAQIGEELGF